MVSLTRGDETVEVVSVRKGKHVKHLAYEAYFKFGHRAYNKANLLITRKWMRDYVEAHKSFYKDMRVVDKVRIIDGALELSFVPTQERLTNIELADTEAFLNLMPIGHEDK